MFNPKALRDKQRAERRQQGGAGMDELDRAAEREGNARSFVRRNEIQPQILGRRISKDGRKQDGAAKTAENRAAQNMVKDTKERLEQYKQPQLAQV